MFKVRSVIDCVKLREQMISPLQAVIVRWGKFLTESLADILESVEGYLEFFVFVHIHTPFLSGPVGWGWRVI